MVTCRMPGLLQTGNSLASLKFVAAFFAEFIGVLLFTLYGSVSGRGDYAAWGNGIALTVLGMPMHRLDGACIALQRVQLSCFRQFLARSVRNRKRVRRPSEPGSHNRNNLQWAHWPRGRARIPHSTNIRRLFWHTSSGEQSRRCLVRVVLHSSASCRLFGHVHDRSAWQTGSDQSSPLVAVTCLQIGLLPGYHVGMGNGTLGCFAPSHGLTRVCYHV